MNERRLTLLNESLIFYKDVINRPYQSFIQYFENNNFHVYIKAYNYYEVRKRKLIVIKNMN